MFLFAELAIAIWSAVAHVLNKNDIFSVDCPMHMEGVVAQYISFSKSIFNPAL